MKANTDEAFPPVRGQRRTPPTPCWASLAAAFLLALLLLPRLAAAQPEDVSSWQVPVFADDPFKGNKDALVTIVEFADFQCPFSSRVNPTLQRVLDTYGNDVRIVWKDNALPFHQRAKPAALLARFAYEKNGDKGFWAAHAALFAGQKNLEDDGLRAIANKLGLSWPQAKVAIDSGKSADKINQSMDLAAELEARGTPHFFINGRRVSGAQPFAKFKSVIDAQLSAAKALVAKGVKRSNVYATLMKTAKAPPEPERKDVPAPANNSPFRGPANAKVVIQEFADFECPFCARARPTVEQILAKYPKDVRIVWRHLPLAFHENAALASEAAQEAFAQAGNKGFWKFHTQLFENQKAIQRAGLEKYATEIGLDLTRFKAALDSRKHKAVVDRDLAVAKAAGIRGTPAFTVNGYFVSGAQPFETFDKVIKRALKGEIAPAVVAKSSMAPASRPSGVECAPAPEVTFVDSKLENEVRRKLGRPEGKLTSTDLSRVRSIDLTRERIDQLDPCVFPLLSGLRHLYLGSGSIRDLTPLSGLTRLEGLRLSLNPVSDLTPLENLVKLDRLDLGGTEVRDLNPLRGMTLLYELLLDDTRIDDVSPLASLTNLSHLSMKRTRVSDVSPLKALRKLKTLDVSGTPVKNTSTLGRGTKVVQD